MKYCGIVNFQNSFICEEILLRLPPCKHAESIMEEHDYPGLRFTLIGTLDGLRQKVKIDISTGDAITPQVIEYRYPLMFENRSLQIMSYNLETLLAEKLETIMYRGTSKTRMRDFYDIYMLTGKPSIAINDATLYRAFLATRNTRRTTGFIPQFAAIHESVESNSEIPLPISHKHRHYRHHRHLKQASRFNLRLACFILSNVAGFLPRCLLKWI